jgi:DNA-binding NtrC family response regulator
MLTGTQVLVVSAHPQHCKPLVLALNRLSVKTAVTFSLSEALKTLGQCDVPVVCACAELVDGDYRKLVDAIHSRGLRSRIVVIAHQDDCPEYLSAMEHGVFDFLPVPLQQGEIERIVGNALRAADPAFALRSFSKTA